MRALWVFLAAPLLGCQAIVGTYELEGPDTAPRDTAPDSLSDTGTLDAVDTRVDDTAGALVVRSCKMLKAEDSTRKDGPYEIIAKGSPGYPDGLWTFCEMNNQATLVATRSSTTNGSAWASRMGDTAPPATVEKSYNLKPDDKDSYLAVDWKLLGGTEVVYDLGAPMMGPAKTRISFRSLTTAQIGEGLMALTMGHPPTNRPNCYVDMSTTAVVNCLPTSAPPADPMKSLGWAYAPTGTLCYFGYIDAPGALGCDGITVGKGRVFVK